MNVAKHAFFRSFYALLLGNGKGHHLAWVYEIVVGKRAKEEYPHLDKKASTREETHEWKRMSRYERY